MGYVNVILMMISRNPADRPPAVAILDHHIFWSRKTALQFLVAASNAADRPTQGSDIAECIDDVDNDPLLIKYCEPQDSIGWLRFVCPTLQTYVLKTKRRRYDGDLISDLLRLLRNLQAHYVSLPCDMQEALGELPSAFVDYWTVRFPFLVDTIWRKFEEIKDDRSCGLRNFYSPTYKFKSAGLGHQELKLFEKYLKSLLGEKDQSRFKTSQKYSPF